MPPKPLILSFDTSAAHCAVAVLLGDKVLATRTEERHKGQAERLFPLIEEVLGSIDKSWGDLDVIGVGIGPGNFTGIRLSVSAARGLALSLGIPAVGVSALEAQSFGTSGVVVSSLDARRGQMYLQLFGQDDGPVDPVLCTLDDIPINIPARAELSCIGFNAEVIADKCSGSAQPAKYPLAVAIGILAGTRIHSTQDRPAPLYIRNADAAPSSDPAPVILA